MSDSVPREPVLSEPTGTFHYQKLIESRLGQPIAAEVAEADAARLASSPGTKLAAGRAAMGWSIEQTASQLRLAPRQVIAIEADDYDALPEPAVVRGFIRAYAKLVKLDQDALVTLIHVEPGAMRMKPMAGAEPAASAADVRKAGKKGFTSRKVVLVSILGLALLALSVWVKYAVH